MIGTKTKIIVCVFFLYFDVIYKNQKGGADSGRRLPLDVFADLHEKNPRIFACENRRILTQKRKASMSADGSCGSLSDFYET